MTCNILENSLRKFKEAGIIDDNRKIIKSTEVKDGLVIPLLDNQIRNNDTYAKEVYGLVTNDSLYSIVKESQSFNKESTPRESTFEVERLMPNKELFNELQVLFDKKENNTNFAETSSVNNLITNEVFNTSDKLLQSERRNSSDKFNIVSTESTKEYNQMVDYWNYLHNNLNIDRYSEKNKKVFDQIDSLLERVKGRSFNELWSGGSYSRFDKSILLLQTIKERLADKNSFNGKLLEKLVKDEKRALDIDLNYHNLAGASEHKLYFNIESIVDFIDKDNLNPDKYINLVLAEELIHLISFKLITREDTINIANEQGIPILDYFKKNYYESNTASGKSAIFEFIRSAIQKEFFGKTIENVKYENNSYMNDKLKQIWDYIKHLFKKPITNEIIQKHIDFINESNNIVDTSFTSPTLTFESLSQEDQQLTLNFNIDCI